MNLLKYKEYEGTAAIDPDRMVCRGKILFIDDLVTYEAERPRDLQKAFEEAVDDYIETCAALGREPKRPLKGQFNVRVTPAQHKAAVLRATQDEVSLNEVMGRALDMYIAAPQANKRDVRVILQVSSEQMEIVSASASSEPQWDRLNVH